MTIKEDLRVIFQSIAHQTAHDFPEATKHLLVSSAEEVIYAAPRVKMTDSFAGAVTGFVGDSFEKLGTAQAYFYKAPVNLENGEKAQIPVIAIDMEEAIARAYEDAPSKPAARWIVHHEVAHMLDEALHNKTPYEKEAFAEAYAALHQVRTFGVGATAVMQTLYARAIKLFTGDADMDTNYYHPNILRHVETLKHGASLQRMTQQQLLNLAKDIAAEKILPAPTVQEIRNVAGTVQEWRRKGLPVTQKKLETLMHASKDPEVRLLLRHVINIGLPAFLAQKDKPRPTPRNF